jgi:Cu/Ag efflux protein CusF
MKTMLARMICTALALIACAAPAQDTAKLPNMDERIAGEIRKIDKELGKLTIKHGAIKHLDMPPMTMVFQVKEKSDLDQVKLGDKVEFSVLSENGKMTVTTIKRLSP